MTLHPDARAFLDMLAGAPPLDTRSAEQNRADLRNALPLTGDATPVADVADLRLPGRDGREIPVRVYRPDGHGALPAVLYFHGGGWVLGDPALADTTTRDLAVHSGAVVVSVDYRLAPEHPFPAAAEDAEDATLAVLGGALDGVDGARVAVAGDSAGGNLAAGVAQRLRGRLAHQVLIYPVTQARVDATASYRTYADGHFLTARDMAYFVDQYAHGVDPDDPRLAPAAEPDLTGLPSATVITAECDPLRDEGEAYAMAMAAAGVTVTLRRFLGQVHPFVYLAGVIGDAAVARRFLGRQLRTAFAG